MIIAIDLDHTLLCTEVWKHDIKMLYREFGLPEKEFQRDYEAFRHHKKRPYSPFAQYKRLKKQGKVKRSLADFQDQYEKRLGDLGHMLHPEAAHVLKQLQRKHTVVLVSYGDPWFQRKKLQDAGIAQYVDDVIITTGEKISAMGKLLKEHPNERIAFFDDAVRHLEAVKKAYPEVLTFQTQTVCCIPVIPQTRYVDGYIGTLKDILKIANKSAAELVPRYDIYHWRTEAVKMAANMLQRGKIIAVPSETSYGFAVDATNTRALRKVYKVKSRDQNKKLPITVRDYHEALKYVWVSSSGKPYLRS
ncbi:Sua5/YciO/YrdC/YwlC family protein, partial [Patescibacteria group bacterium]